MLHSKNYELPSLDYIEITDQKKIDHVMLCVIPNNVISMDKEGFTVIEKITFIDGSMKRLDICGDYDTLYKEHINNVKRISTGTVIFSKIITASDIATIVFEMNSEGRENNEWFTSKNRYDRNTCPCVVLGNSIVFDPTIVKKNLNTITYWYEKRTYWFEKH